MASNLEQLREQLKKQKQLKQSTENIQGITNAELDENEKCFVGMKPGYVDPEPRAPVKTVDWTCPKCNTKYNMLATDIPHYMCDACILKQKPSKG